jgi:hypothetical protein
MISSPFKILTARAGVAVAEFILGIRPAQNIDACTHMSPAGCALKNSSALFASRNSSFADAKVPCSC